MTGFTTEPGSAPIAWPQDATRDRLVGDWHLWQRRRGHRTSTDDVLTAWLAVSASAAGRPQRYLDLGCGVGSVLLLTAHALRPLRSIGVEVQPQSVALARRTIAELPDPPGLCVYLGDLRASSEELREEGPFSLITGSPPYFPDGTGTRSSDPQRAACRFELRGGVEDYCRAAAALLEAEGVFCLVFQTAGDVRVRAAVAAAGLYVRDRVDVAMRTDRAAPFLSVYGLHRRAGTERRSAFAVRDARGAVTPEYSAARALVGLETAAVDR